MTEVARDARVFRIGIYELTAETGELRKDGKPQTRLQAQPLQVLLLLLERPAQVVTRDELREKIWPANTFVDFDHGVNTAITSCAARSATRPRIRVLFRRFRAWAIVSSRRLNW